MSEKIFDGQWLQSFKITTARKYISVNTGHRPDNHWAVSASQNIKINIPRENPYGWRPFFSLTSYGIATELNNGGFRINLQNRLRRTFTDNGRDRLQHNEANCINLNAGLRLESSYIPPVRTVPLYAGQIESVEKKMRGSAPSAEPSRVATVGTCGRRN